MAFVTLKSSIPKGSTIKSAVIKNLVADADWNDSFTAGVRLIDKDSTPGFTQFPKNWPVTGLTNWDVGPWTASNAYDTADIKDLVQAYIDRPGYDLNNYIGIRIDEGTAVTGQHRRFRPADNIKLEINYDEPSLSIPSIEADVGAYDFRAGEEALCYQCHRANNEVGAPDIYSVFSQNYGHTNIIKQGLHEDTENASNLSDANRHSECQDCHDPHKAKPSDRQLGSNLASGPNQGVKGVGVINGAAGSAPLLYPVNQITYEYELCFKCHSNYVTGGSGANKAKEFNPNNAAYHPVEGLGKNLGINDEAFVLGTPWNPTTGDDPDYGLTGNVGDPDSKVDPNYANGARVTCTDCHG